MGRAMVAALAGAAVLACAGAAQATDLTFMRSGTLASDGGYPDFTEALLWLDLPIDPTKPSYTIAFTTTATIVDGIRFYDRYTVNVDEVEYDDSWNFLGDLGGPLYDSATLIAASDTALHSFTATLVPWRLDYVGDELLPGPIHFVHEEHDGTWGAAVDVFLVGQPTDTFTFSATYSDAPPTAPISAPAPESATWALIMVGAGMIGCHLRAAARFRLRW